MLSARDNYLPFAIEYATSIWLDICHLVDGQSILDRLDSSSGKEQEGIVGFIEQSMRKATCL